MQVTRKTIEIENELIKFVSNQAEEKRRSFTGELNDILQNEKNRVENRKRKDNE